MTYDVKVRLNPQYAEQLDDPHASYQLHVALVILTHFKLLDYTLCIKDPKLPLQFYLKANTTSQCELNFQTLRYLQYPLPHHEQATRPLVQCIVDFAKDNTFTTEHKQHLWERHISKNLQQCYQANSGRSWLSPNPSHHWLSTKAPPPIYHSEQPHWLNHHDMAGSLRRHLFTARTPLLLQDYTSPTQVSLPDCPHL